MKINKILLALAVAMTGLLSSCDTDNEGAVYSNDNQGISFTSSTLADVTVSPADPTFEVEIVRSNAAEAFRGTVSLSGTINKQPFTDMSVTDYTFQPGEYKTTVKVDISALQIGKELSIALSIDDTENVSAGGIATTTLTASKDYDWVSLGTGTYADNWGWGITYNVEIQKADGFNRWRVVGPYKESEINDDGEWEDWLYGDSSPYFEFWLNSDGIVYYNPVYTGINYQGTSDGQIYIYHPALLGLDSRNNKFLDDKTVQLAPYYYIPSLGGGFNMTSSDRIIIITLP